MPGSEKDVYVDVYIDRVEPLKFRVISKSPELPQKPPTTEKPNGDLIFVNNHHPGFKIHFILQGKTHGYLFPKNKDAPKAIWSQLGEGCPTTECWEVFENPHISPDGKKLTVTNRNPCPAQGDFGYTLRVTNDGGETYRNLGPGGTNTNGPSQLSLASYTTVGVATLAFAAYSAYAFRLLDRASPSLTESYVAVALGTVAFAAFAAYARGLVGR